MGAKRLPITTIGDRRHCRPPSLGESASPDMCAKPLTIEVQRYRYCRFEDSIDVRDALGTGGSLPSDVSDDRSTGSKRRQPPLSVADAQG
jgi:hypothetical protein